MAHRSSFCSHFKCQQAARLAQCLRHLAGAALRQVGQAGRVEALHPQALCTAHHLHPDEAAAKVSLPSEEGTICQMLQDGSAIMTAADGRPAMSTIEQVRCWRGGGTMLDFITGPTRGRGVDALLHMTGLRVFHPKSPWKATASVTCSRWTSPGQGE